MRLGVELIAIALQVIWLAFRPAGDLGFRPAKSRLAASRARGGGNKNREIPVTSADRQAVHFLPWRGGRMQFEKDSCRSPAGSKKAGSIYFTLAAMSC
jgi:hypothetical protein